MQLALDIGNTRRKLGLFDGPRLLGQAIWTDWTLWMLMEYIEQHNVQSVIVSTVADPVPELIAALRVRCTVVVLDEHTPLPFQNAYRTPATLGKDRLAAVAGAQALFPRQHCAVVDCGTCIKYELLHADGVYLGGNIAPGAMMRIQAMHHFTARLPEVELHMPDDAVGYSTETALQNGALRGAALEIEGFIQLFQKRCSPLQVLLTGGDAAFFYTHTNIPQAVVEPNLTLIGLRHILHHATDHRE